MTTAQNLDQFYLKLLQDTLSANRQMEAIVPALAEAATEDELVEMLNKTKEKMPRHNRRLETLIRRHGGETDGEQCKGMEGLVREAREHSLDLDTDDDATRDAAIILAVQQMSHYGLAGYGTAAAMARALGFDDDADELDDDLDDIYDADRYLTYIAERQVNREAAA